MRKKTGAGALLLFTAVSAATGALHSSAGVRCAGIADIADTVKELSDLLQGIRAFLSGMALISETIGFSTILLIIAVIVFSAGFSAIGVPRGAPSFFASLITADALWILWKIGFNTGFSEYSAAMIKSNLIVLSPLMLAAAAVRLFPPAARRLRNRAASIFRRKRVYSRRTLLLLRDEFQAGSAAVDRSLVVDLLGSGERDAVALSSETLERIESLKAALSRVEAAGK